MTGMSDFGDIYFSAMAAQYHVTRKFRLSILLIYLLAAFA